MPELQIASVIVKELNYHNDQSVLPVDVGVQFLSPTPDEALLTAAATGLAMPGSKVVAQYQRLPLEALQNLVPSQITILKAPTIHLALHRIAQALGITFLPSDIVDETMPELESGVVALIAESLSLGYTGQLSLEVIQYTQSVESFLTDLSRGDLLWSASDVIEAFLIINGHTSGIVVGFSADLPLPHASQAHNTQVTLTADNDYGFVGSRTVYYNRLNLATTGMGECMHNQPFTGTIHDFLLLVESPLAGLITPDDIVNDTITFTGDSPLTFALVAKDDSYTAYGTLSIECVVGDRAAIAEITDLSLHALYPDTATASVTDASLHAIYQEFATQSLTDLTLHVLYPTDN